MCTCLVRRVTDSCYSGVFGFVIYPSALAICPADEPIDPKGKVDWVGAALGLSGLILFNFTWK